MQAPGRPLLRPVRRPLATLLIAALLSIALATDVLALTWGPTKSLTISRNASTTEALAVTTGNVFHAVFETVVNDLRAVRYRRSTDGGATWSTSVTLSSSAATFTYGAAVASHGGRVDATWIEERGGNWVLIYRRSTDAGATWRTPIVLSGTIGTASASRVPVVVAGDGASSGLAGAAEDRPGASAGGAGLGRPLKVRTDSRNLAAGGTSPSYPRLSRNGSGVVIVTWTDDVTGRVYIRRSTDSGATFVAAQHLDTTTSQPEGYFDAFPDVAAGTGVHYLVYYKSASGLRVRRSTDGGVTWSASASLATNGSGYFPDIVASGPSALVGYAVWSSPNLYTAIRRTVDSGATWRTAVPIGATTGNRSFQPKVAIGGGSWHVAYERCVEATCDTSGVYYRSSTTATTWVAAVRVSNTQRPYEAPGGLAYGGRLGLAFDDNDPDSLERGAYFRAGS